MANLDPIHWCAVGLGGACLILGISTWTFYNRAEAYESRYDSLQSQRKAEQAQASADFEKERSTLIERNSKLEKEIISALSAVDKSYAEYQRMLSNANNTNKVRLSDLARQLTASEEERTRLATKVERFEKGVVTGILQDRDETIVLYNQCLDFAQGFPKQK